MAARTSAKAARSRAVPARSAPARKAAKPARAARTARPSKTAPRRAPSRTARSAARRKAKGKGKVVSRHDDGAASLPKLKFPRIFPDVHRQKANRRAFKEGDFGAFFQAEIEAELLREAEIFNDRIARWRCQCCDAVIPVPRRTVVFHGEYMLEHDDIQGLLINGEKFVPRSETPLEVQQPGRLRNPYTGRRLQDEKYQPVDLS